ncbi:SPOR domain-containing protein [Arcticibacterium luteifluviistationis]|nr:SPOR domain-containing protein [Arcticibacterium luteifluviistationis]
MLFFLFSSLLFSCARNITSNNGGGSSEVTGYEESLAAVRPKVDYQEKAEKPEEVLKEELNGQAYVPEEPKNENAKIDRVLSDMARHNSSISDLPGYRLQVYAGNDRGGFEQAKSYILQHFPELEIYESYSQPTYRIKVGDFLKKMDAERYYSSIVSRFSSAKVIMDNVDVQKSLKIN